MRFEHAKLFVIGRPTHANRQPLLGTSLSTFVTKICQPGCQALRHLQLRPFPVICFDKSLLTPSQLLLMLGKWPKFFSPFLSSPTSDIRRRRRKGEMRNLNKGRRLRGYREESKSIKLLSRDFSLLASGKSFDSRWKALKML